MIWSDGEREALGAGNHAETETVLKSEMLSELVKGKVSVTRTA